MTATSTPGSPAFELMQFLRGQLVVATEQGVLRPRTEASANAVLVPLPHFVAFAAAQAARNAAAASTPAPDGPAPAALDIATVRAVLALFEVDYEQWYYNSANDYGSIDLRLQTGNGNPWDNYRGAEVQGEYYAKNPDGGDGLVTRGTGRHRLNEAAVQMVVGFLQAKAAPAGSEAAP